MSQSTYKLAGVADEMRAVTEQSAGNLKTQQKETDHAAVAMQELATIVQDIAHHASEAEQSACKADQGAHGRCSYLFSHSVDMSFFRNGPKYLDSRLSVFCYRNQAASSSPVSSKYA